MPIFLFACKEGKYKKDLCYILGINNVEGKLEKNIDKFAGFGEFYIIEIYDLSDRTIDSFINRSDKLLPEKEEYKNRKWESTPFDSTYKEIINMALNYYDGNKTIIQLQQEIQNIISDKNNYYSFYYKPDIYNPQYVQLFILDLYKKRIFIIESQF